MEGREAKQPKENPIERELNDYIDSICSEFSNGDAVRESLVKFKDYVIEKHISKDRRTINSLNALISLIGGQDGRVMQLLNHINS